MDKILFICTSDHSYYDILKATERFGNDVTVAYSSEKDIPNLNETINTARPAAIIAPPITGEYIKTKTKKPCIAIHPSQFDILDLLMRARSDESDTVYYIGYKHNITIDSKKFLESMLGKKLSIVTYETDLEKLALPSQLDLSGIKKAAVTSGWVAEQLQSKGIETVLLHWKESSVLQAINTATEVIKQTRREAKFNIWLNATLNNVQDGIIGTQQGSIFTFNKRASEFFGVKASEILGKNLKNIDPDSALGRVLSHSTLSVNHEFLWNIRGKMCMVNVIPIAARQTIIIIKDKNDINRLHANLSKEAEKRGMVAKYEFHDILGDSTSIKMCKDLARKYSKSNVPVLLLGETGVGKELFAHSIHNASSRANAPFVSVNCSSVSEAMLESELFGYDTSSSSSKSSKIGLIEMANGGTLFLDEIGEMSLKIQSKLLAVIQNKELTHVHGNTSIPVDVRIISSTNKKLEDLVNEEQFRKDLYYRLSTLTLNIPSLRERREDIPILANALYQEKQEEYGRYLPPIPKEFINSLMRMEWPGNIRELQSYIERYVILASDPESVSEFEKNNKIISRMISSQSNKTEPAESSNTPPSQLTLDVRPLKDMESEVIYKLSKYYTDTELSKVLDIGRSTVWRKLKEFRSEDQH